MRLCTEPRPTAAPGAQRRGQLSPQRRHDQGADHARQQGAGVSGGGAGGRGADACCGGGGETVLCGGDEGYAEVGDYGEWGWQI